MSVKSWCSLGLAAASLVGAARADDDNSGNQQAPAYLIYPRGADLAQKYGKPAGETENNLTGSGFGMAAAGRANHASSASVIAAQPMIADAGFSLLPENSAALDLNAAEGGNAELNLAPAAARSLQRFSYRLQHRGVPFSKFTMVSHVVETSGTDSRTLYIRSTNTPDRANLPPTTPTVDRDDAARMGRDDAKAALADIDPVVSRPGLEILVNADGSSRLVWSFNVQARDPGQIFARHYWVSARDQAGILRREDQVYLLGQDEPGQTATILGHVTGDLFGKGQSPLDPPSKDVLQDYLGATLGPLKFFTNSSGVYTAIGTTNTKLMGPFAVIVNQAGGLLAPTKTGADLFFNANTEGELAQTSAFYWVNFTHEFARPFLPASPTVLVNNTVNVNINMTCNAFWQSANRTLNFFKAGGGCVNSAYCDVVCHEYGHGIDTEFNGIHDGGYSEGFGDSVAILITHSPIIGKDFLGKGKNLRNATEIHTWPPSNPEVHEVGKIYNGFTWQLTRELLKTHSEADAFAIAKTLVMGAAMLDPKDIPNAVRLSFVVDAKTGSKHFKELAAAADSRHIPRPQHPVAVIEELLAEM